MSNDKNMEKVGHLIAGVIVLVLMIPGFAVGGMTPKVILFLVGMALLHECLKPFIKDDKETKK